ncbi:MAG: adenylate kinase [Thermoplasmatales archaeon]
MSGTKVVIGGIPGVGKTTVLQYLTDSGIDVENFGDIMLKEALSRGYVDNRDQMRKMPLELQLEIQKKAAEYFSEKESVVIDTHLSVRTKIGFLPGLPRNILEIIRPDLIISLEADPHEIFLRRSNDSTRARDSETEADIKAHIDMNRMYGTVYSAIAGCALMTVKNETNKAEDAAREIILAIKGNDNKKF